MMNMIDCRNVGISQTRRLVDAAFSALHGVCTHGLEARRELREAFQRRARTRKLLVVERERAIAVVDRDERTIEASILDRG